MLVDSQQLSLLKSGKSFNDLLNNESRDYNPHGFNETKKANVFMTEKPDVFIRDVEGDQQENKNQMHKKKNNCQENENKKEIISKLDRSKSAPIINQPMNYFSYDKNDLHIPRNT